MSGARHSYTLFIGMPPRFDGAACDGEDPDLFFPEGEFITQRRRAARAAIRICQRCPARTACLEWALDTRQPAGVWGGKTVEERNAILKARKVP